MNKQQNQLLGLDKIYDLIDVPGSFLETVKRYKLSVEKLCPQDVEVAYRRRGLFLAELRQGGGSEWNKLLAHIGSLDPSVYTRGSLAVHELFELKSYLYHYQALRLHCKTRKLATYQLPDLQSLFRLLDPEGGNIPSFRLSPLYSSKLQELDQARGALSLRLKHERYACLEKARQALKNPNLKEEFVLPRSQIELIDKIQKSQYYVLSRENIANLIFNLADSPEALIIKNDLAELSKTMEIVEEGILMRLSEQVAEFADGIATAVASVLELGWDYSLAAFALKYNCCLPEIGERIDIKQARNLPLQLHLEKNKRKYQKQNLNFCTKANLITGPNMGGKTSILKCLAQFAQLICRAIPLPAESVTMPIYEYVFYNHSSEGENLSSFGSEVVAFSEALKHRGRGLYLLDEFAKGTNPREGEALATAVIRYLSNSPHTTIAATHFTAPAMLQDIRQYQIKGIDTEFCKPDGDGIQERLRSLANAMNYELISLEESKTPPMDAFRIARILGLPEQILELVRAEEDCQN